MRTISAAKARYWQDYNDLFHSRRSHFAVKFYCGLFLGVNADMIRFKALVRE